MGVPAIPPTLVLVDDHAAYRACLGDLLRQRGLTVLGEAGDTAALLHWLAAAPARPDLVLMDVQMPGGGPAGLQALVQAHPGLRVLVPAANAECRAAIERTPGADASHVHILDGQAQRAMVASECRASASPSLSPCS